MQYPLTVLDLFCGAGGLSLGFQYAGFDVIRAIDSDHAAVRTYLANVGPHALVQDLSQSVDLPMATVVVGGPPCQGFSSAGLRRRGDHRNTLVSSFAQAIVALRPVAFVFENVEGFLTGEGGAHVRQKPLS